MSPDPRRLSPPDPPPSPRRVGVIYPSNGVCDTEFLRFAPPDVTLHVTRFPWPEPEWFRHHWVQRMTQLAGDPAITDAARLFTPIDPAAVTFACTAASFAAGAGGDHLVLQALRRGTSAPASTTATAFVAACRALGRTRVAIASVYRPELTERFIAFLAAAGITTVSHASEGWHQQPDDDHRLRLTDLRRMAAGCDHTDAQAVLIPETNIHTSDAIPVLEAELNKPVITAIHATVWHAARLAGSRRPTGIGHLGRCDPAPLAS
ncbi:hypothetical protein [Amycolatopsis sp. GM8]|uniref:maleate cis-trans isomerase family protein n=1 Tax=Amycolatopsis sp. GM8 TaxID=2896530 RepID=UPI001F1C5E43|nr:hypothetical protein [Amycolatopsis sp. GM8]